MIPTELCLNARRAQELFRVDIRLLALIIEALAEWPAARAVVTSLHRTAAEDAEIGGSGVHVAGPPWRACDLWGPGMTGADYAAVADALHGRWVYDPTRPEMRCACGQQHGTGLHLHLQVHAGTARRETTCALPTETTSSG